MPTKTTTAKKTRKPTQRVRQWTNNEIMKALTADHDCIMKAIARLDSRLSVLNSYEALMREAEEAKPIEFGTRVKVNGAGGIYWYASGDKHKVVFDCGSFLVVPRNEITVISPKP